ncbi:hypothetical protein B7486_32490 [cyanobacterium TDX16]|nr:hypothetical protein B7486_32490 [cyanobacterium TDX16]
MLKSNAARRSKNLLLSTQGIAIELSNYFKLLPCNIYLLAQLSQEFVNFVKKVCVSRYNISWEEKLLPAVAMGTHSFGIPRYRSRQRNIN